MELAQKILLELHYLPSIQYCSKFIKYNEVIIEGFEHYQKGSFRNKTFIAAANGPLRLTIPLMKGKHQQQSIKEVRIAYHEPWRSQHWQSILSAYGNAPFFDYYADHFRALLEKKYTFLFDLNLEFLKTIKSLVFSESKWTISEEYNKNPQSTILDFRNHISPKNIGKEKDPHFRIIKYVQVFEEKHGFLPNLSILDSLFCLGPETRIMLEQSIVKC